MNIHHMMGVAINFTTYEEETLMLEFDLRVQDHRRSGKGKKIKTESLAPCVIYDTAARKILDDYDPETQLLVVSCTLLNDEEGFAYFRVNEFRFVGRS